MPNTKTTRKRNLRKLFVQPRFFTSHATVGKQFVTIKLPRRVLSHVDLAQGEVYWTVVNNVLQITGSQPQISIPVLSAKAADNFVPQPE